MRSVQVSLLQIHDECSELVEELSLEGFGKEVSDHLFRWTIFNGEILHIDAIGDKIEATFEMLGSLAA